MGLMLLFFIMLGVVTLIFFQALRRKAILMEATILTGTLVGLLLLDFLLTAPIYLLPKTLWPPLQPEMTWREITYFLTAPMPGGGTRWWSLTLELFITRPPGFCLIQLSFLLAAFLILYQVWLSGWLGTEPRASRTATHGSARWRKRHELKLTLQSEACDNPKQAGVVIGSNGRTAWLTQPQVGNPHVLLLGATRSGKSRRVILPTVWAVSQAGESMILTDPKGELYTYTAGWLHKKGYNVVLLDLLNPARGNRWNPLSAVVRAHQESDTEEAVRLAWEIGHILAWSEGPGSDPIWPQAEESLITALCLAAALEAPLEANHMTTAYRILIELGNRGGESLDAWFTQMPPEHPARMAYGTASLSESRTRASIYTGTAAHLRLWGEPGIAWMCADSDHDPAEAGIKPMAIFLLMPDEAGARRYIASLYINQAYSALAYVARGYGGRLPVPVWFLLDEFGNIGKLPAIAEKLTVSAGRNIRFVLAIQAIAQLAHVYGDKTAEIIQGNCDTWLYLRTADIDTARAISAKAGNFTVRTLSVQRRPGLNTGGTEGAASRALLTPDEVLRWPSGYALLLQAGQFPARLPLTDLSTWKAASAAFQMPREQAIEVPRAGKVTTWLPAGEIAHNFSELQDKSQKRERDSPNQDIFGRR